MILSHGEDNKLEARLRDGRKQDYTSILRISLSKRETIRFGMSKMLNDIGYESIEESSDETYEGESVLRVEPPYYHLWALSTMLVNHGIIDYDDVSKNEMRLHVEPKEEAKKENCYLKIWVSFTLKEEFVEDKEYFELIEHRIEGDETTIRVIPTKAKKAPAKEEQEAVSGEFNKTPSEIKAYLDDYVISQESAKTTIAVAIYNHYKKLKMAANENIPKFNKSNILIMGPTGTGKTEIVETIANLVNVPFAKVSAASLTATGYVGDSVTTAISNLYLAANKNVEQAERGIVFVDEIDKIASVGTGGRDVSGEDVQYELLKLLEGSTITIQAGDNSEMYGMGNRKVAIKTDNILFVCAGAFQALQKEKPKSKALGFASVETETTENEDVTEKLIKYGIIPELVGRIPVITQTENLSEDDLSRILVEPKRSLVSQYQMILGADNVKLEFSDDAIKAIAHKAAIKKTGARALQNIVEQYMTPVMFKAPDIKGLKSITITKEYIDGEGEPMYNTK